MVLSLRFILLSTSRSRIDARIVGAVLAGMPCIRSQPTSWVATEWHYDKIQHRLEEAYGRPNLGMESSAVGLRGLIMRTPGQRQQNFALESLMNEAAAFAGVDPIEFRLRHISDQRLIDLMNATAKAAGWEARPSPHSGARRTGYGERGDGARHVCDGA